MLTALPALNADAPRPRTPLRRRLSATLTTAALVLAGLALGPVAPASATPAITDPITLASAFAAGGPVTLDGNITVASTDKPIGVLSGRSVTLDLNGYTLNTTGPNYLAGIGVPSSAGLTVTDSRGGGQLTATGGAYSAGIGGPANQAAGSITIQAGTVTANGGQDGAGIGGGVAAAGGSLTVTGGNVIANGSRYSAGIGGGFQGAGGTVTITGGTVTATGGIFGSSAIGAGTYGSGFGSLSNAATLTIPVGSTLEIPSGATASNSGTLNVAGELTGDGTLENTGAIINTGAITPRSLVTINNFEVIFAETNPPWASVATPVRVFASSLAAAQVPIRTASRTGYTLTGWATADTGGTAWDANTTITGDLYVYTQWVVATYEVSFDSAGGTATAPRITPHGTMVSVPLNPSRTGYTFTGWFADATATTTFNFGTPITANLTLTARWVAEPRIVTFDNAGGNSVAPITTDYDTTVTAPANPTRTGYTFSGWFADATTTAFDFATPITANTTLTARWAAEPRTVTFDSNGGDTVAPITTGYGTPITAPAKPTRSGYTFTGWFADAATTAFDFATPITANLALTARWTLNTHTLTFDSNGGSGVAPMTADYGTVVTAPTDPTRGGYTFTGWFADAATTTFNFNTPITANLTLTAQWAVIAPPVAPPANSTPAQTVTAGNTVTVSGTGFAPGQQLQLWLRSEPVRLGTLTAGADGTISSQITLPVNTPAGEHHLVLIDASGNEFRSGTITVPAEAVTPTPLPSPSADPTPSPTPSTGPASALPSTGADPATPLGFALMLLLAGAALAFVRSHRARTR